MKYKTTLAPKKGGIKKAFLVSFGAFVFLTLKLVTNFFIVAYKMTEKY